MKITCVSTKGKKNKLNKSILFSQMSKRREEGGANVLGYENFKIEY